MSDEFVGTTRMVSIYGRKYNVILLEINSSGQNSHGLPQQINQINQSKTNIFHYPEINTTFSAYIYNVCYYLVINALSLLHKS